MGLFNWLKGKKKGQDEEEKVDESFTQVKADIENSLVKEKAESESSDDRTEELEPQKQEEKKAVEVLTESTAKQEDVSTVEKQLQEDISSEKMYAEIERNNVMNEVQMEKQIKNYIDDEIENENNRQNLSEAEEMTAKNTGINKIEDIVQTQNIANDLKVQNETNDIETQSVTDIEKEEKNKNHIAEQQLEEENNNLGEVFSETEQQESEEIKEESKEKKMGFFKRLVSGLTKTRNNIVSGIDTILKGFSSIDDDFYEELEEILIMGDIGVNTTMAIIEDLKEKVKEQKIKEPAACKELLIESIKKQMAVGETAYEFENRKSVILLIGVNGVGKTTTIGKLSGQLKQQGKKVMVAAADTFRAAAIDQLAEWAKRANVDIIAQQEGSDPAAVVYDAVAAARARNTDILLCDTAGRLHNKKNLMEELRKINKVIDREYPDAYKETLVVLDGTTGQNALAQAKQFNEVAEITGIVLTKLDGTAKGGIAIAIQSELGIPVKYIGIGEKIEDLQKFNSEEFVNALFDVSE